MSSHGIHSQQQVQHNICEAAIEEFVAELEPKERDKNFFVREVLLQRKVGLSNEDDPLKELRTYVKQLETKGIESRGRRNLEKLAPLLEGSGALIRACESLFQAAPLGVGVAFSGLRIVLSLATRVSEVLDDLFPILENVGFYLDGYSQILVAQPNSEEVFRSIKRSYKRILELWYVSAKVLSNSLGKTALLLSYKPLKEEIRRFKDDIFQDYTRAYTISATVAQVKSTIEKHDNLQRSIVKWIQGSTNYVALDQKKDLERIKEDHTEGTCQWLFETEAFKTWIGRKDNAVLWYHAPPGTGKSTMASVVTDNLQKALSGEVVYFFYSINQPSKREAFNGIRSLILQLLLSCDPLPDDLVNEYSRARDNFEDYLSNGDIRTIHKLLKSLLDSHPTGQVYLVLDGLDECSKESPKFFDTLGKLLKSGSNATVKWFFSSCNVNPISRTMLSADSLIVEPNFEAIANDIRAHLKNKIHCPRHEGVWFGKDEQSFLHVNLRLKILKDTPGMSPEQVWEEFDRFPRELGDCFVKQLERIALMPDYNQARAKQVFQLLTLSERPLTVRELLNFLRIDNETKDYTISEDAIHNYSASAYSSIADVCNPFIAKVDTVDSQIVKLYHKSVRDFFLAPENKRTVAEHLKPFLVDERESKKELGKACLEYLNSGRFKKPTDLKGLPERTESSPSHAFLRYASIFWFKFLSDKDPSSDVIKAVETFLQSPAFWTCIYVQIHTAPHLFARFRKVRGTTSYQPLKGTTTDQSTEFGLPLPGWLMDCSSADCASLDRSLWAFVQDWGELLTTKPDQLGNALPTTLFEPGCYLKSLDKHPEVRARYMSTLYGSARGLRVMDFWFAPSRKGKNSKSLFLCIINEEDNGIKLYHATVFPKLHSLSNREIHFGSQPLGKGWTHTLARGKSSVEDSVSALRVDPQDLGVTRQVEGTLRRYSIPRELHDSFSLGGTEGGSWKVVGTQRLTQPDGASTSDTPTLIHMQWKPIPSRQKQVKSDDSDSDSGSSSDSDSETSSDSASDSDSDSTSGSISNSDSGIDVDVPIPPQRDCLVMVSDSGIPLWRPVKLGRFQWFKFMAAHHPLYPLVAMSLKPGVIDMTDLETGMTTSVDVPNQAFNGDTGVSAWLSELRFSTCGNYLHIVSIMFKGSPFDTESYVYATTLEFRYTPGSTPKIEVDEKKPVVEFKYTFSASLDDLPSPFALTYWGNERVTVALPPLTFSPKVVKISLTSPDASHAADTATKHPVLTLNKPVFFPKSAVFRNPHMAYTEDSSGKEESHLYLIMDTSESAIPRSGPATVCGLGQYHNSNYASRTSTEDSQTVSPPVVMRWKISHGKHRQEECDSGNSGEDDAERQTWREWNDTVDDFAARRRENIEHNALLLEDIKLIIPKTEPRSTETKTSSKTSKRKANPPRAPTRQSRRIAEAATKPTYHDDEVDDTSLRRGAPRVKRSVNRTPVLPESDSDHETDAEPSKDVDSMIAGWTAWEPEGDEPIRDVDGTLRFETHPDFRPNKSPEEIIREGSFGGSYWRPLYSKRLKTTIKDDWKELPASWTAGLDVDTYLTSTTYDPETNKYGVQCGQSIEEWEAAGWIAHEYDVRGWFQWYCRFYMGRRCDDDERQISRWKKCVGETGRWRRILLKKYVTLGIRSVFADDGEDEDGPDVSPVVHQTCHHWAYESPGPAKPRNPSPVPRPDTPPPRPPTPDSP
ncbi:unnamed protein product [Fusarium graminearum]|nr:unnamed protein product [Fusarium graminearum]